MWWWLGRPSVDFVFDEGGSGWNASSTMPRPTGEERLLLFELVDSRRVENTQATGHRDFASGYRVTVVNLCFASKHTMSS